MSALPSAGGGYGALHLVLPGAEVGCNGTAAEFPALSAAAAAATSSGANNKRKRRPAGTPDPGAEVVALSPKTLMESDRYVCEICNQGFQRDQNLQMHRRRHKVPWKLLKRPSLGSNKRVYICPERSCLHHDPAHALGDLVGIKKHYRRKHCTEKQWKCDKCSKGYAVQSDYKAHLKTCGTRGHCCDCGRVFSRVESFIEHQDTCSAVKHKASVPSGDRGNDRVRSSSAAPALKQGTTDRNSTGSPSQSSDTTHAMSFGHSGMSDTAARSSAEHAKVHADEHSRRIQSENQATPSQHQVPMPAWLRDRNSALELLAPTSKAHMIDYSKSHATRSSSVHFTSVSCRTPEPSLQLSMGPYGAEVASSSVRAPYVDTKPSFNPVLRRNSVIGPSDVSLPAATPGKRIFEGESPDQGAVGFLMQRLGPERNIVQASTRKQQQQNVNSTPRGTEMVANYNPCGSTSSCHEDLAANAHESGADAQEPWVMSRRGFTNSRPEPATSSVISCRPQGLSGHRDHIAEDQDHIFAAKSKSMPEVDFRSAPKQSPGMTGLAHGALEPHLASEQVRTDMNAITWSDLARSRRSRDEARQECEEAQRDIARAEALKQEAREQLQFAAAERAYAERARELARRQIEVAEADLARAKRLREQAQSELAAASPASAFCLSCKSALDQSSIPQRSSPVSSTWSFMTPASSSDQAMRGGTGMNLWPAPGYRTALSIGESRSGLSPVEDSTSLRTQSDRDRNVITPKLDLDLN